LVKMAFVDAPAYEAAKHFGATTYRLQHRDLSGVQGFWVGLSYFLPGGGAETDSSDTEKVYVVLSGSVAVISEDDKEYELGPLDSLYIPPNAKRRIINKSKAPATMLVIATYPKQGGARRCRGSRAAKT